MNKQILDKESLITLTLEYIENQLTLVEERNISLDGTNSYCFENSPKVKLLLNENIDIEFYKNVTRGIVKKISDIKNILKTKHYIYGLSETPSVKDIRYIGRTNNSYRRLFEHSSLLFMNESKEKDKWLFDNLTNSDKEIYIILLSEIEDLELLGDSFVTRESLISILEGKYIYYLNKSLALLNKQRNCGERYLNGSVLMSSGILVALSKIDCYVLEEGFVKEKDTKHFNQFLKILIAVEIYRDKYKEKTNLFSENKLLEILGLLSSSDNKNTINKIMNRLNNLYLEKGDKKFYSVELKFVGGKRERFYKFETLIQAIAIPRRIPKDILFLEKKLVGGARTRFIISILTTIHYFSQKTISLEQMKQELGLSTVRIDKIQEKARELLNHCKKQRWIFGWERLKNNSYKSW